jgi:peroxiredoxin (alkyl hydroperoxide reductase subunit C)
MTQIGKSIPEFNAQAFHNGEFIEVSTEKVKGKW